MRKPPREDPGATHASNGSAGHVKVGEQGTRQSARPSPNKAHSEPAGQESLEQSREHKPRAPKSEHRPDKQKSLRRPLVWSTQEWPISAGTSTKHPLTLVAALGQAGSDRQVDPGVQSRSPSQAGRHTCVCHGSGRVVEAVVTKLTQTWSSGQDALWQKLEQSPFTGPRPQGLAVEQRQMLEAHCSSRRQGDPAGLGRTLMNPSRLFDTVLPLGLRPDTVML